MQPFLTIDQSNCGNKWNSLMFKLNTNPAYKLSETQPSSQDLSIGVSSITTYISRWASQIQSWWHLTQNWWHCRWWSCYDRCFQPSRRGWHACSSLQEDSRSCDYERCLKSRYPQPIELWREDLNWKSHTRTSIFHQLLLPEGLVVPLMREQLR